VREKITLLLLSQEGYSFHSGYRPHPYQLCPEFVRLPWQLHEMKVYLLGDGHALIPKYFGDARFRLSLAHTSSAQLILPQSLILFQSFPFLFGQFFQR